MAFVDETGCLFQAEHDAIHAEDRRNDDLYNMRREFILEMSRPSMMLRPHLSQDGNKWIALYGDDIQTGVVGIGDSPALAYANFDQEWVKTLPTEKGH
jgi:hypothetical protein